MPYTGPNDPNLPEYVANLPAGKRRQWVAIWNNVYDRCMADKGDARACEAEAFRLANGVVKAVDEAVDALADLGAIEAEVLGANLARAVVRVSARAVLAPEGGGSRPGSGHGSCRVYVEVGGDAPPSLLGVVDADGQIAVLDGVAKAEEDLPRTAAELERQVQEYAERLSRTVDVARYAIVKQEQVRRYTLGVAYPAAEVDAHGDFTTAEELELAAWNYLARHRLAGVMHEDGTEGAGIVVESYIYRGPPWRVAGQEVSPGDWMVGVVWDEPTWERIQKGELTGFSIQGSAVVEDVEDVEDVEAGERAAVAARATAGATSGNASASDASDASHMAHGDGGSGTDAGSGSDAGSDEERSERR